MSPFDFQVHLVVDVFRFPNFEKTLFAATDGLDTDSGFSGLTNVSCPPGLQTFEVETSA